MKLILVFHRTVEEKERTINPLTKNLGRRLVVHDDRHSLYYEVTKTNSGRKGKHEREEKMGKMKLNYSIGSWTT
ncbi:hypothetical protein C5167_032836 [Papaver somniferum]|uniref:Uncharacterized protein n=1 Tax=Papaver somniferum TaxID=3469 RepID=A0A4Y7KA00_PAPSO|nr:hypothetical protein C5167_032836 [Papaver somniferum]